METRHTQTTGQKVPIGVAARELGVSVETVRRWEAEGKIQSTRTAGGQRRFEMAEIERVKAGDSVPVAVPDSIGPSFEDREAQAAYDDLWGTGY